MALATTLTEGSPSAGPPAELGLAPDAITAEIMRRHGAGEKLSPQEYGKLGAWKAKLAGVKLGRPARNQPVSVPRGPVAPGPAAYGLAPVEAPADSAPVPAVDPAVIQRTTEAILTTCDQIARTWVVSEAKKAGADVEMARGFDQAAALQPGPKELMVKTSPEVVAALGIDANNYPIAAFCTGLSVWAGSLLVSVNRLKAMQDEKARREKPLISNIKEAPGAPADRS